MTFGGFLLFYRLKHSDVELSPVWDPKFRWRDWSHDSTARISAGNEVWGINAGVQHQPGPPPPPQEQLRTGGLATWEAAAEVVNLDLRNSRNRVFLAGESFQLLCNFRPGKLFLSLETEDLVAIVPFYDLWADPSLDIDICLCLGTRNNHLTVTATANFLNNSLLRFPELPPSPLTSYLVLLANSQAWSESKLFSKKKILPIFLVE